ncbi:MAG: glycerol acyltransferase [Chloroflexi bacterium]|nr:glycerol acyltransferase [Chloroflexota bacterium]
MQTQLGTALVPKPHFPQGLIRSVGSLAGWSIKVSVPIPDKCVIIGAHHTASTDFILAMFLLAGAGVRMRWVTKDDYFKPGLSPFIYAFGGMPVNRRQRSNFVGQMVAQFQQHDVMRLGIMPEGTRKKAPYWKTGFYYIALGAQVPIVFGYADYPSKEVGIGGILMPTGDIIADFATVRRFYANVRGRHPQRMSELTLRQMLPQVAD